MSLVYQQAESSDKPDNSQTFFSARRPASTVLCIRSGAFINHPWRYFVAGGDSLAKIEQVIAESKTVDNDLRALAAEVGAKHASNGYFTFKNAEVEAVAPQIRLHYLQNKAFISDPVSPGDFFPDQRYGEGIAVKKEIIAIQSLPVEERNAARDALAKKYEAESFDGKFFHFHGWEDQIEPAPMQREKKFRLKSNPAFVQGPHDNDAFRLDWENDEGLRIATKVSDITSRRYPEQRFADWISSFALDISLRGLSENRNGNKAEAEKIGEEWIIKVPVIVEGIFGVDGKGGIRTGEKEGWVMPPGAKPITVSQYFNKLENSGTLRALPTTAPTSV